MAVFAVVAIVPLLGACVSAVDDSSSFGFNASAPAAEDGSAEASADGSTAMVPGGADAAALPEPGTEDEEAPPVAAASPSADAATVASATADTAQAEKAEVPGGTDTDDRTQIASGRTTIAAYSGATVDVGAGAPAESSARKADSTLFASLFTQSEAKTPLRNSDNGKSRRVLLRTEGAPEPVDGGLPGVKTSASLFEIGQRASADYDAEIIEEASGEEGTYEVASLGGMARLAPNGLRVQRPDVDTGCFEPKLVSMLRAVEARFQTKVVVTSGYRSPSHNKRVNGAKRSMHMACKAADVQVPGANKIQVANFVRSLPGRGGVGTYCHTTAIHIDIGRERDWNWACRRRRS